MKSQPCTMLRTGLKVSVVGWGGGAKSFCVLPNFIMVKLGRVDVFVGVVTI